MFGSEERAHRKIWRRDVICPKGAVTNSSTSKIFNIVALFKFRFVLSDKTHKIIRMKQCFIYLLALTEIKKGIRKISALVNSTSIYTSTEFANDKSSQSRKQGTLQN